MYCKTSYSQFFRHHSIVIQATAITAGITVLKYNFRKLLYTPLYCNTSCTQNCMHHSNTMQAELITPGTNVLQQNMYLVHQSSLYCNASCTQYFNHPVFRYNLHIVLQELLYLRKLQSVLQAPLYYNTSCAEYCRYHCFVIHPAPSTAGATVLQYILH